MAVAQDLAGRRAIITGGSGGLGRSIAERLSASGVEITIVDLEHCLKDVPPDWNVFACDLGNRASKSRLENLATTMKSVDIVVANAGIVPPWRGMTALDSDEWQAVMAVNVWGVAATLGAFAEPLARSGRGSAIVMASINGYKAHPKQVLYSASKHAVIGVMRAAALDLGPSGVRVNALAPGPIATDALLERVRKRHEEGGPDTQAALADLAKGSALGRIATADDVANAAHFLASDASAGMTGSVFPVDAGLV